MNLPALYRVEGSNETDGEWEVCVYATSPGQAVDAAAKRKSWDISGGIRVNVILDFIDTTATIGVDPEAT